jgi:cytoskeleton protein RodZ
VLAGVVILAVLYGVWHIFFASGDATPPVPPPPTLARITEAQPSAPTPAPTDIAPAIPETTVPPVQGTAPVTAPAPQTSNQTPNQASNPVAIATPEAAPPPGRAEAAVPALPANAPQSLGQQTRDTRVVLRARGQTRITVTGRDGRILLNRDLKPGEVYYVPNQAGVSMALSNAGAVDVDLDGVGMGRAGAVGQVVGRVSLDPQSLVDRFNSR